MERGDCFFLMDFTCPVSPVNTCNTCRRGCARLGRAICGVGCAGFLSAEFRGFWGVAKQPTYPPWLTAPGPCVPIFFTRVLVTVHLSRPPQASRSKARPRWVSVECDGPSLASPLITVALFTKHAPTHAQA